jgi:hypothetical protein
MAHKLKTLLRNHPWIIAVALAFLFAGALAVGLINGEALEVWKNAVGECFS